MFDVDTTLLTEQDIIDAVYMFFKSLPSANDMKHDLMSHLSLNTSPMIKHESPSTFNSTENASRKAYERRL